MNDPSGRWLVRVARCYNFNSSHITDPLRDKVTSLGWAWKAAPFKL